MLYKKYSVQMELTGLTRKKAAEILSDVLKNNMIYDGNEDIYGWGIIGGQFKSMRKG